MDPLPGEVVVLLLKTLPFQFFSTEGPHYTYAGKVLLHLNGEFSFCFVTDSELGADA